jgi:hypothetical protein
VDANISNRQYEVLLLRRTDALAVYGEAYDDDSRERNRRTLTRAVQIFETCVLIYRALTNLDGRIDAIAGSLSFFSMPWKGPVAAKAVIRSFAELERDYMIRPPVQSVEADRLLRVAYEQFGVPDLFESTRRRIEFLERRLQWVKTQWLVSVGVLTFFLDLAFRLRG